MRSSRIQERAAEVRTTWTLPERMARARATDRRCRELLAKLGVINDRRGPTWGKLSPVAATR